LLDLFGEQQAQRRNQGAPFAAHEQWQGAALDQVGRHLGFVELIPIAEPEPGAVGNLALSLLCC